MTSVSKHLDESQLKGLLKAGDILIPGDERLPSFSQSNSVRHVDRMLDFMYDDDRAGLQGLLRVFAFTPRPMLRLLLWLTEKDRFFPGIFGAVLRMVHLGVKGVVMTLYYSDLEDGEIHAKIHWDAKIATVLEEKGQT